MAHTAQVVQNDHLRITRASDTPVALWAVDAEPAPVRRFPETAVLRIDEVAEYLQVSVRTVERDPPPSFLVGEKSRRWLVRDVIRWMQKRSGTTHG